MSRSLFARLLAAAPLVMALFAPSCSEYDLKTDPDDPNHPNDPPGPNPDIVVVPTSLSFGVKVPDCPSDPKVVKIKNVGDADLVVDKIKLGGDASAYTLQAAPVTIAPGDFEEISVEFLAHTTTVYNGEIRIESNDPDEDLVVVDMTGEGGDHPTNEDIFQQNLPESVDVLWVLDNSCSMSDDLAALEVAFDGFIQNFVQLGLDYQIGVVTTDMDNPAQSGKLQGPTPVMSSLTMTQSQVVAAFDAAVDPNDTGSADEKPLAAAYAALQSPGYAVTGGLVRSGGNLSVIIVTDEDDSSPSNAQFYVSWLNQYKPDPDSTSFAGIISQNTSLFNFSCSGTNSPKLQAAIDNSGGMRASICDVPSSSSVPSPAFEQVLTWLSFNAAGLTTEFTLSNTPAAGAAGMTATVDGVSVPYNPLPGVGTSCASGCFSYSIPLNTVYFHGPAIPGPGATVVVTYPIAATCSN